MNISGDSCSRKRDCNGKTAEQTRKFQRLTVSDEPASLELHTNLAKFTTCMKLRKKWMGLNGIEKDASLSGSESPRYDVFGRNVPTDKLPYTFSMDGGVARVTTNDIQKDLYPMPPFADFVADYKQVRSIVYTGAVRSYGYKRLALLEAKFGIHELLNADKELAEQKAIPSRDLSNVRKVDTHVHHSGCMTKKHLLDFIRRKLADAPDDVVVYREGRPVTLKEVFEGVSLTSEGLSLDRLDMHAHDTYQRFDRFNNKFNPAGEAVLREVFLKTDNALSGRYLAEITKEVIARHAANQYTLVEWRISIYGRKASEWANLARWFYIHRLAHYNVRWIIQVPRIYHVYRSNNQLQSFGQMLRNIFEPLLAHALDPSTDPALFYFLEAVVGFDSVDDESIPEHELLSAALPEPDAYTAMESPPYAYWMYYMATNIAVLNQLRLARGLRPWQFRPHAGEAGDPDHLIATYLVAHGINHGVLLRRNAALQYLYYLDQIGIAMSPLCNAQLFVHCHKNPFPRYFRQGMNMSLSTDTPLLCHYTEDGLAEEYAVCAQMWKLSSVDTCEIARNSVLQSGLERGFKQEFLGADLQDPLRMNVPTIRMDYRAEALQAELDTLKLE